MRIADSLSLQLFAEDNIYLEGMTAWIILILLVIQEVLYILSMIRNFNPIRRPILFKVRLLRI